VLALARKNVLLALHPPNVDADSLDTELIIHARSFLLRPMLSHNMYIRYPQTEEEMTIMPQMCYTA